jgi:monoamine oxidase
MPPASNSILIIGAGMAGLTAARTLAEAGRSVTLLEAASRVGGRIHTIRDGNEIIELGAEFIHGRPPELWSLIEEASLETYELDGAFMSFEDGQLQSRNEQEESTPILDKLETQIGNQSKPDISFAEYIAQRPIPDEQRYASIGYVEGFNAADHRQISILALGLQQSAEEEIESDRLFRIRTGYDRLPKFLSEKFLAAGGSLHLNTLVERIDWAHHQVRVHANTNGTPVTYEATQAIITLPLGVLQQQSVAFVPVPDPIHEAHRLRMGHARRFTLIFREPFWQTLPKPSSQSEDLKHLSFLLSFQSMPPVWWTSHPAPSATLTGWVGGPRSEALANKTSDQLAEIACTELAHIFSLDSTQIRAQLLACYTHNWQLDALSVGAYSYVPVGAIDACSKMTIPADSTLFFAGEHTDTTGHWGTVHAAIRTGRRAARQILTSS